MYKSANIRNLIFKLSDLRELDGLARRWFLEAEAIHLTKMTDYLDTFRTDFLPRE